MDIKLHEIKIKDLYDGYIDEKESYQLSFIFLQSSDRLAPDRLELIF